MSDERVGLCASCVNARVITSARESVFYLCELSFVDARFARYPALPVLACTGYVEKHGSSDPDRSASRGRDAAARL